ncbi:hypothetical protein BG015_009167 [Linnemannia schmuckeri]|uniref:Proteasome activator subunit 4 n=1 Tax=Linnemannia schmuckeri TaxID=64567 RepID=A0A9P5S5S8_9FUNG|nr:hypothetical protein BG015_009167 [Linnemannia schmuckeri]
MNIIERPDPQWGDLSFALHNILPYANDLALEASEMLNNIIHHLGLCLKSEDYAPGALYWGKQLHQYLDLKYALPKQTRVSLAKVFWELTTAPGMDATMVEFFALTCRRLVKKKDLIGREDLILPWRPLYDILERTLFPKNRQRALLSESKRMLKIVWLAEDAQRLFPAEAPLEILEEFLPKMSTSNLPELLKAQSYLATFLPTSIESGMDPREWLPAVFRLWSMVVQSTEFDRNFLALVGRVAVDNIGVKDMFTQSQIRTVFAAGLSALNLPVGKGQRSNAVDSQGGTSHSAISRSGMRMITFVMFIINTINPVTEKESPESSTLAHLAELIQATESFYHPSNYGKWSYVLALFLEALARDYLERWNKEKLPKCKTPQEYRLTTELNKRFVETVRGVTYQLMFSKDQRAVATNQKTLRYLAWIEPSLIIPGVLERAYPSLESLTESHRTTSVISALGALAVPMLNRDHYPQGGKHLAPLLHLTVPGVDMNDPVKTWYTLLFVTSMVSTVPIRDLTEMGSAGFEWGGIDIDMLDAEDTVDLELEDSSRKASTADFEEWLMKFLRRVILMFENYPDTSQGAKKDQVERSVTATISYCFESLFQQLSPKLYDMTTKLVIDLVESAPLSNAENAMGTFISCWAGADSKNAMARLFPTLDRQIRSELEHGASSVPSLTHSHLNRDDSLHYYQTLLDRLIGCSDLLSHKAELISLIKLMTEKCQDRRGYKLAAKAVCSALSGLLVIAPMDLRSHEPSRWNDPAFMSESHNHWGTLGTPGTEAINWHVPSQDEINFAIELIDTFHVPAMERLRDLMTSTMLEGKQLAIDICKSLTMVKAVIASMVTLVEDDGDSPASKTSDDAASVQPLKRIESGYCLTDLSDPRTNKVRKIRAETGKLLHELMTFFQTKREDDVVNIKIVVKAARVFLSDHGVDSNTFDNSKKGHDFLKDMHKIPGLKKVYPRFMRCRRASLQLLLRLKINSFGRAKTEMHDSLMLDLTELSLSQYTDVRKKSQLALIKAVKCYQGAKNLVLPILLKSLESSNTDFERIKGALYLLNAKAFALPCLRDWRFAPEYILRLCTAHHADKPSVQTLVRKCFMEYIMNLTNASFKTLISSKFGDTIHQFIELHSLQFDPDTLSRSSSKTNNRRLNNIKAYDNLVLSLTELVQDESLHWRYQTMAMSFLELLMRPEIPCSREIAEFETKSLLSEMPTVRRIALSSLSITMVNIKVRTYAQGDPYSLIIRKASNPLKRIVTLPDTIPDDFTWEYLKASVTEINYDHPESSLMDDSTSTGWLAWPRSYKAYLPRTETFVMPEVDAESRPAFDYLEQFFGQELFWEKHIEYVAQEPVRGERHDSFSTEQARLYKSIFGLWEDKFLDVIVLPLTKLCAKADDKNSQRTAAELMGGLIRGSKHWKKSGLDRMWTVLTPLLKKAFQQCTPDSLLYWERFVKYCCHSRDPRRVLPLITLIFNTPLDKDSTAAFSESKNLFFTRAALVSFSWRVSLLTPALREDCLHHATHPYKQVREILGHVINELFQLASHPSYKSVDAFLKDQKALGGASSPMIEQMDEKSAHQVAELVKNLEKWRVERPPAVQGASDYTNASKTVLAWVYQALTGFRVLSTYGVVLPLVPEIFQMQDIPDDQDLQQLATLSLLQLGRFVYPAGMVPTLVDMFCKILKESTSWHVRNNVLPVVQIFFYNNLYSMDVQMMVKVMDAVSGMLLDPQIEVRQLAASTLSGIVRCSQRAATQTLISHFKKLLLSTPLPARNKRDRSLPKEALPEGYSEAVVKRHAGVLGLSCLLEAFPYDVPQWMPEAMVFLAKYFSDPPPISTTVKKTFGDFKRTHQDTWHEDQKHFDPEQLEVLSDMLISPSYYA